MKGMKAAGPKEINAIRKRAIKLFAMGRIDKPDCDFIVTRLDEIDSRIQIMPERERGE